MPGPINIQLLKPCEMIPYDSEFPANSTMIGLFSVFCLFSMNKIENQLQLNFFKKNAN